MVEEITALKNTISLLNQAKYFVKKVNPPLLKLNKFSINNMTTINFILTFL